MTKLRNPRNTEHDQDAARRPRKRPTTRQVTRLRDLLMRLSALFITLPSDQVDIRIVDGLRQLVETLGVQRASMAVLDEHDRLRITHSYAVRGFRPMREAHLD